METQGPSADENGPLTDESPLTENTSSERSGEPDGAVRDHEPDGPGEPADPERVSPAISSPESRRTRDAARVVFDWFSRPPIRLIAAGIVLLLVAGLFVSSPVWALLMVIVGSAMILTAWIGSRLAGHLVIEWGDSGMQVDLRTSIRSERSRARGLNHPPGTLRVLGARRERNFAFDEPERVEIDVAELKALIAAAESGARTRAAGF